jgi:hypothetical protein
MYDFYDWTELKMYVRPAPTEKDWTEDELRKAVLRLAARADEWSYDEVYDELVENRRRWHEGE